MKILETCDWEEFQSEIRKLIDLEQKRKDASNRHFSPLLFRGQSDATWSLATTLERFHSGEITQSRYRAIIDDLKISVETALESELRNDPRFEENAEYGPSSDYPIMIYARHHGFPSPLLDWTRSWFIALFFALANAKEAEGGRAAIYVYREHCGSGKSNKLGKPHIVGWGPYVRAHPRHFHQQAEYTVCGLKKRDGSFVYASHEAAFGANTENQDALWKLTVPWSEKRRILHELHLMNVNAFTLFGSVDSLMGTLAFRLLGEEC
jgi:hypothetical protein